jgi:hypothetical protein
MYQVWLHTRAIDRLGALEGILNTPSRHRVHHGANPPYLDKNFGSALIVFDLLFGTSQEEGTPGPEFGTVKPFTGHDPLRANIEPWRDLARAVRTARTWRAKLHALLQPPAALPPPAAKVAASVTDPAADIPA